MKYTLFIFTKYFSFKSTKRYDIINVINEVLKMEKKLNKNQKRIMKIVGTILFAIALVLLLNLLFNGNKVKIDKKYVGVWKIGYKFYSGQDKSEKELYTYEQELHLLKDGTFFTKVKTTPAGNNESAVSGTYEASEDKLILLYEQNGTEKSNILEFKQDKLCTDSTCSRYYTKDKIENFFDMFNASVTTEE